MHGIETSEHAVSADKQYQSGREAGADGQKSKGECPISDKDVQRIADYLRKSEGERRREARSAKQ